MQAIILAAGMGKRLGELTKGNTKCMIEVGGETLISRLLQQLDKQHLSRIVMVIGYKAQELRDYLATLPTATPIEFVENTIYDKTNNIYSLYMAKDYLCAEDTLLFESDIIMEDAVIDKLVNHPYPNLALVDKFESWMDGTVVTLDSENRILRFIPNSQFRYEEIPQYYKTVNIYKFSRDFSTNMYVPFLEAYCTALGRNEYYEQVLRVICMLDNSLLKALPITDEKWYEIDDAQDLDIANAIFAEGEEKLRLYMKRYGGYWRFPKLLDFCYLVNPYFPSPKMKDEMRSNFDTLLTEYPSGMYVNSLIAGKCFGVNAEHIVVGNGAAELIKSLMESLEGRFGVVYPTFEEYPNRLDTQRVVKLVPQSEDFHYDVDALIAYFENHPVENLLLINPDNPSGNYIKYSELLRLIDWARSRGCRLVVDESFADFSDEFPNNTLLRDSLLMENPHLVVMKSISKSFGVPGVRLGVLASGDRSLVSRIKKDVSIWNINSFAEFFLQIYSKYDRDYRNAAAKFVLERERFREELAAVPFLTVYDSQANYFLCRLTGGITSSELARILLCEHDILVKDCSTKKGFEERNYIRIAIRNREDNSKLVKALLSVSR